MGWMPCSKQAQHALSHDQTCSSSSASRIPHLSGMLLGSSCRFVVQPAGAARVIMPAAETAVRHSARQSSTATAAASAPTAVSPSEKMTKIKPNTIVASDEALLVTQAGSLSASAASPYAIFSSVEGLEFATKHLHDADEKLRPLITKHGPPHRLLAKEESVFKRISQSIVFQQLATQAAVAIYARVLATCGCSESLTPGALLGADPQALRAAGLSQRKVEYLLDLAAHFTDGRLTDEGVRGMDLETLQRELVQVRGLGTWSVHMFALFHRGCADVLPVGDLGVRKGMQMLYGLRELPDVKAMERVAEGWKPYRSAGAWYMWKVVEDEQEARVAARAAKAALAAEAKLARLEARAVAKALKEASPPKRRKKAGEEE